MVMLAFCTTLKERSLYSNCHKLNKTGMLSDKISIEFVNSKTSSPSTEMSRLSSDSYPSSNLNFHVKIVIQGHCPVIITLSFLWTWHSTRCNVQPSLIKQEADWIEWICIFLLFPSTSMGVSIRQEVALILLERNIWYKHKRVTGAFIRQEAFIWESIYYIIYSVLVEFVVGSLCCSRRFFSEYSKFTSPQKPTFQIPLVMKSVPN